MSRRAGFMTYATDTADVLQQVDERKSPSAVARTRMLSQPGEAIFYADWMRALMMHFEADAEQLQRAVPYQLDLHEGRAFVTLVAFTMENMRPRIGGRLGAWLLKPIATHDFLNVRTYVRHNGEPGIHFLAEWLSNWLAVQLGPVSFGLPYRHGRINYDHHWETGRIRGRVTDARTQSQFSYRADLEIGAPLESCAHDSLDAWLMERYTAFNAARGRRRFFRVWHPPWPQAGASARVQDDSLLTTSWPWFAQARLVGANYSPGLKQVWMGKPHRV